MTTGSPTFAKTIGIVRVSRWRATVTVIPPVRTIGTDTTGPEMAVTPVRLNMIIGSDRLGFAYNCNGTGTGPDAALRSTVNVYWLAVGFVPPVQPDRDLMRGPRDKNGAGS